MTMTSTRASDAETVLVMNPQSGTGDHYKAVHKRATLLDYEVRETQSNDHAIELAKEAAKEGIDEIIAVGGDGTLNEVVHGVHAVGALDRVTVGVVPAGTGNDFASNIGIEGIDAGFHAIDDGRRRQLDIGTADEELFLNSCVAGITAEASDETSSELKSQFGVLAYVITTLEMASGYSGINISASVDGGSAQEPLWEGTAVVVLVGNGRQFTLQGSEQANIEDGLFDVTIIESAGSVELAQDRLAERLLGKEGENINRFLASSLEIEIEEDDPATFSFDGEMSDCGSVRLQTRKQAVTMPVGEGYQPRPSVKSDDG